MKTTSLLSEKDRKSLTRFYRYVIIWKCLLLVMIIGLCFSFLCITIAYHDNIFIWCLIFVVIYGWFSFKANQKQLVNYEIDIQENIKIKVTGRMVGLVFEEAGQYITFCEDGFTENEIFLLSYKNDKQLGGFGVGDRVELEYTPYWRFLLCIRPL